MHPDLNVVADIHVIAHLGSRADQRVGRQLAGEFACHDIDARSDL